MAVLHRRASSHGRFCGVRPGADLRFPCGRHWFCALCDGSLCGEHRHDDVTFSGDIQEQLLRRRVTEPMDGPDSAGKLELQRLADELDISIEVHHLPPGT